MKNERGTNPVVHFSNGKEDKEANHGDAAGHFLFSKVMLRELLLAGLYAELQCGAGHYPVSHSPTCPLSSPSPVQKFYKRPQKH